MPIPTTPTDNNDSVVSIETEQLWAWAQGDLTIQQLATERAEFVDAELLRSSKMQQQFEDQQLPPEFRKAAEILIRAGFASGYRAGFSERSQLIPKPKPEPVLPPWYVRLAALKQLITGVR